MRTVKQPAIVKGPASGRRLLCQFSLTDSIIEQSEGGKKNPAAKKTAATVGARKRGAAAKAQKARRN